ncbi:MAG: hypothetical protein E5V16_00105 [Mesorhizobium sp.]|nr:MAG: hypothetical protein E5V16_00105 [Mesorhizobium sp.]
MSPRLRIRPRSCSGRRGLDVGQSRNSTPRPSHWPDTLSLTAIGAWCVKLGRADRTDCLPAQAANRLLHLTASINTRAVVPSTILKKLSASPKESQLAKALRARQEQRLARKRVTGSGACRDAFANTAVFCKSTARISRWQRLSVARVLPAASTAAPPPDRAA